MLNVRSIVVKKARPGQNKIHVDVVVREKNKSWEIKQEELPVIKNDHMSPWLMAPPDAVKAFRKMEILEHEEGFSKNPRIGDLYDIIRGVMTGTNDIFLIKNIKRSATINRSLLSKAYDIFGEFNCQGLDTAGLGRLRALNKGRPNEEDLKKAEEFARNLKGKTNA
jgi:hypothetical protein